MRPNAPGGRHRAYSRLNSTEIPVGRVPLRGIPAYFNTPTKKFLVGYLTWFRVLRTFSIRMPGKSSTKRKTLSRKEARDLDVKITFLEGLVRRDACYVEALQILGDHYTQRGKFDSSLKVDQQLSQLEPQNALVFYNLACSYSRNEAFDQAAAALERALNLGYRDFKWLARDPDLLPLRQHPLFRELQIKIRKLRVKVT